MKRSITCCTSVSCLSLGSTLHLSPSAQRLTFRLHQGASMASVSTWDWSVGASVGDWEDGERTEQLEYFFPQLLPWGSQQRGCAPQLWGPARVPRPLSGSRDHVSPPPSGPLQLLAVGNGPIPVVYL